MTDRPAHAETSDQGARIGRAGVAIPNAQRTSRTASLPAPNLRGVSGELPRVRALAGSR